jgi:phosphate starvation-inducible protein PhoH
MATTKKSKAALFHNDGTSTHRPSSTKKREDFEEGAERRSQHQPIVSNALRLKLDNLQTFDPLTDNQKKFFDAYKNGDYFMGLFGSPGTGKTFCAMYKAIEEVMDKTNSFKQVVVVRSAVQVRDQGFVSGDLEAKQAIYEQPYKEICATLFNRADAWDRLKEQGFARFITTTAIRGISIDDAVVIVDEAQSQSWHELHTVMSRVGYRSKIMFCGDLKQNDLIKSKYDTSGLEDFMKVSRKMKEFTEISFTTDDIVRSSLCRSFIIACEEAGF